MTSGPLESHLADLVAPESGAVWLAARVYIADEADQRLAEKDAELLALRAAHEQLREVVQEEITHLARWCSTERLVAALAASPPHPETEGQ